MREYRSPTKKETAIIRSSAAEYLTFVAASGSGGVEAEALAFVLSSGSYEAA